MAGQKTILLIDDEIDLIEMVQFQLQAKGFNVVTANNGQEGLERLQTIQPDLIVLDMNMPKMGGIEFYQKICDSRSKPRYPIFILTARANLEQLFKDFEIKGFMAKPFAIDQLIAKINEIVAGAPPAPGPETAPPPPDAKNPFLQEKSNISVQEEALLKDAMLTMGANQAQGKSPRLDPAGSGSGDKKQVKAEPSRGPEETRRQILILEDNRTVSDKLKTIFSDYNCLVHIVNTAAECFDKAPHWALDLIILKHFINDANTEELAERLKNISKFYRVPIILYDNIGQVAVGDKESDFVLNEEGNKVVERTKSLLHLTKIK